MYVNVMLDNTGLHMFVTLTKPRGYNLVTAAELSRECCIVQPENLLKRTVKVSLRIEFKCS